MGDEIKIEDGKGEDLRTLAYRTIVTALKLDGNAGLLRSATGKGNVFDDKDVSGTVPALEEVEARNAHSDRSTSIALRPHGGNSIRYEAHLKSAQAMSAILTMYGLEGQLVDNKITTPVVVVDTAKPGFEPAIQKLAASNAARLHEMADSMDDAAKWAKRLRAVPSASAGRSA